MYGISIQDILHQDNFALLFTWNLFCSAEYYNNISAKFNNKCATCTT